MVVVIAFHLGLIGGGFVGVDVFFVISGYLITGIIYREMLEGRFTIRGFYERRARRILPALIVVVLATAAAGYVLLYPGNYAAFGRSALSALVGVSNIFFLTNTGYFDAPSQTMPLLHTWSLGVEEQFYLVWPAVLIGVTRLFGRKPAVWRAVLVAIIVVSFGAALIEVQGNPKLAFYAPHTRAWELALGGLLVFVPSIRGWVAELLPPLGIALIGAASFMLRATDPFPGLNALEPVIGAALVIYPIGTRAGRAIGLLAPLGRISYSLYLWHWPIIAFWRIYLNGAPLSPSDMIAIVGLATALSMLSWRYVEQPMRRWRFRHVLRVAVAAEFLAAMALAPIVATAGVPARIPAAAAELGDLDAMWHWPCPETLDVGLLSFPNTDRPYPTCVAGAPWKSARHHAILWGDSNAVSILPLISLVAARHDTSVALVDTCPAILHKGVLQRYWPELPTYNQYCEASRSAVLRMLDGPVHIDLAILAASWSSLAELGTSKNLAISPRL